MCIFYGNWKQVIDLKFFSFTRIGRWLLGSLTCVAADSYYEISFLNPILLCSLQNLAKCAISSSEEKIIEGCNIFKLGKLQSSKNFGSSKFLIQCVFCLKPFFCYYIMLKIFQPSFMKFWLTRKWVVVIIQSLLCDLIYNRILFILEFQSLTITFFTIIS